jgi:Spy/CpxP family protein refolding chaperone
MKKVTLVILLIVAVCSTQAQRGRKTNSTDAATTSPAGGNMQNRKQAAKQMMRELNLSKDQTKEMKEVRQNTKAQREAIKNDATLTDEQKKEKVKALAKESGQKISKILTPEQLAKLKAMQAERRKKAGNEMSEMEIDLD